MHRIGLISDTHGLLRPQALEAMRGSEHILHAGDIGGPEILAALERIAPVTAVRGNNDVGDWARAIPERDIVDIAGVRIHLVHDLAQADTDLKDVRVVVTGHSHKPKAERRNGVLFVNPGSAGPRRFTLPISVGYLLVRDKTVEAELFEIQA